MTSNPPTPVVIGYHRDGRLIRLVQGGAPGVLEQALTTVGTAGPNNGQTPLQVIRGKRDLLYQAVGHSLQAMENRGMLASEKREHDRARVVMAELDERAGELEEQESRNAVANAARAASGEPAPTWGSLQHGYTSSQTYHRGADSPSFFKDLLHARSGDADAADRLRRNNHEVRETRALGNTGGTGGSGGEFSPPGYLLDQWIRLARPGRVTADLCRHEPLPPNVSSVQLPKITSGTTTTIQSTQNTTLSQTDLTSAYIGAGISTIGGKQVVSQQLVDQSGIPFDNVVMEDLAADYARQLGQQVLTGTGTAGQLRGYLTPASSNVVTWTQATPTVGGFYGRLALLQSQIAATRFAPPDVVIVHPRRWGWLASYQDSTGRPLVVPSSSGQEFNTLASTMGSVAAGHVGNILGMDVYSDPSIPITLGAGANQDVVLMTKRDDLYLYESDLRADIQSAPYADSLGLLFRCWNYASLIPDRYTASLGQIVGTGLVTPTYAS